MSDEAALMTAARESAATASAFGADLYPLLAQDAANTVFSPLSVTSALWMAWCGARGQTAAELARALHLNGPAGAALDGLRSLSALVGDPVPGTGSGSGSGSGAGAAAGERVYDLGDQDHAGDLAGVPARLVALGHHDVHAAGHVPARVPGRPSQRRDQHAALVRAGDDVRRRRA